MIGPSGAHAFDTIALARHLVGAIAGFILTGCVSLAPPSAPQSPVPLPDWFAAAPEKTLDAAELPEAWWRELGDPRLDALVGEAFAANPALHVAASRIAAAEARARIAGADLVPRADVGLDAVRRRQVFVGLPIRGDPDRAFGTTARTFGTSLNLSWEVDLWGRIRAGRAAAVAEVGRSHAEFTAARLSLAGQVAKAWFAAVETVRQEELARSVVEAWRETREVAAARYRRGLVPSTDLRLAETGLAQAEATLELRRRQVDLARRQLEILLGRYPAGSVSVVADLPPPPPAIPAGVPAEILARRPDLAAAEQRLAAAGHRVSEARAALYPQLRLTGSAGTLAPEVTSLLNGEFGVWSLAGSLLQPLFEGGRLRAGVDLAEASFVEALAQHAQEVLRALAEVEAALAAETLLARQEETASRAAEEARGSREAAEARYRRGVAPFLLVLESQRQLDLVRSQLLEVRRQRLTNRVDLLLALGGGLRSSDTMGRP